MPKKPLKKKPINKALKQKQKQSQRQVVNVNIGRALREAVRRRQPIQKPSMTQIFRTNEPSAPFHFNYQPFSAVGGAVPNPVPIAAGGASVPNAVPLQMGNAVPLQMGSDVPIRPRRNLTSYEPRRPVAFEQQDSDVAPLLSMLNLNRGAGGAGGRSLRRRGSDSGTSVVSLEDEQSDVRTGYKTDYQSPEESYFSRGAEPLKYPPIFEPNREPSIFRQPPTPSPLTQSEFPNQPSSQRPSRRRGGELWNWEGEEKALKDGVPIPEGKYWNRRLGKFMKIPK